MRAMIQSSPKRFGCLRKKMDHNFYKMLLPLETTIQSRMILNCISSFEKKEIRGNQLIVLDSDEIERNIINRIEVNTGKVFNTESGQSIYILRCRKGIGSTDY